MRAQLKVLSGFVRIYRSKEDIRNRPAITAAPFEGILEDGWGVGSATSPKEPQYGTFRITALADGKLRIYSASGEEKVEMEADDEKTFETIEENALTVSDGF